METILYVTLEDTTLDVKGRGVHSFVFYCSRELGMTTHDIYRISLEGEV